MKSGAYDRRFASCFRVQIAVLKSSNCTGDGRNPVTCATNRKRQFAPSGFEVWQAAAERGGNILKGSKDFRATNGPSLKWLKPRPESGLDWLVFSKFAEAESGIWPRLACVFQIHSAAEREAAIVCRETARTTYRVTSLKRNAHPPQTAIGP